MRVEPTFLAAGSSSQQQAPPPRTCDTGRESHLLFQGVEIELDQIGKTSPEHKIGHATSELRRQVVVVPELTVNSPARRLTVRPSQTWGC